MTGLQLLWYILICLLFIVFICLEGADFGVGMSYLFITKDKKTQNALVYAIEPTWDGSEVWLVTAIGAMFASFPIWYGSLLSGYYLLFLFFIICLIFRGVAIHFRLEVNENEQNIFDKLMFIGSLFPPFLLGVIFASMSSGVLINSEGHIQTNISNYFNLFTIVAGITVASTSFIHGLNFLNLKTGDGLRSKVINFREKHRVTIISINLIFICTMFFFTEYFTNHFVYLLMLLIILIAGIVLQLKKLIASDWNNYIGSTLMLVSQFLILLTSSFPNVITDIENPSHSITIQEASSSPQTLKLMTIVVVILIPLIIAYQIYAFSLFRKRITSDIRKID